MTSYPRICVSSTGGGGGKTLLSLGLARALSTSGTVVKPFKKGPDYIDAAWLACAAGISTTNLDPFFLNAESLINLFLQAMQSVLDINQAKPKKPVMALIEGNRGLYDGLDESGSCSTAYLARTLNAPLLLCMNSIKTTRTMAAILKGLQTFEAGLNFCGVVLNRVGSPRHESSLRKAIEYYTDVPVLGALPRLEKNPLPEKHMGLVYLGHSYADIAEAALDFLGRYVAENCDVPAVIQCAQATPDILPPRNVSAPAQKHTHAEIPSPKLRIGYVQDEALWFYYPENLNTLHEAGCSTVKLSLLDRGEKNSIAWENLDGIYLGGGFPEDNAEEVAASPYLQKINELAKHGMPIYAECGGLIILCKNLQRNGMIWPMCGIFPHEIVWHNKPRGLGYVEGEVIGENPFFPLGKTIRGHEFHYSSCNFSGTLPPFSLLLHRGNGLYTGKDKYGFDGLIYKNVWASYTHIFAPAVPCWAANFALAAKKYSYIRTTL